MYCMNCQKNLLNCTCVDLADRVAEVEKCPHVIIGPAVLKAMKEQGERNKNQNPNPRPGEQSLSA